jgi:hypothetical protein
MGIKKNLQKESWPEKKMLSLKLFISLLLQHNYTYVWISKPPQGIWTLIGIPTGLQAERLSNQNSAPSSCGGPQSCAFYWLAQVPILFRWYQRLSIRAYSNGSIKATLHLHQEPTLRMRGFIPPITHTFSGRGTKVHFVYICGEVLHTQIR